MAELGDIFIYAKVRKQILISKLYFRNSGVNREAGA